MSAVFPACNTGPRGRPPASHPGAASRHYPGGVAHRASAPQHRPSEDPRGARPDAEGAGPSTPGGVLGQAGGRWPGDLLGLPQAGPTSLAPLGRRVGALCIDWAIALLVSALAFGKDALATLAVFAVMHVVGLTLLATTVGKAVCRIQVLRLGGRTAPVHRVLLRTVLLCLVLPALLPGPDGRALHDQAAGTVELRM